MTKLVQCVPNFSEGKDKSKLDAIIAAAKAVPGVSVLDVEMDPDHHRSVLTFVAPADAVLEAAFQCAAKAKELINLSQHTGGHPRIGAVDVIPFIPIGDTTMEECSSLAHRLGERIGKELQVPVFLYGFAATIPERKDLTFVRKGQFEGMKEKMAKPDFGPDRVHPTAGAIAVGARDQIVNLNFNLTGLSLDAAGAIAKKIRASGGGLPCLRAKEVDLKSKGQVQITTVLTDYRETGLTQVYDAVQSEISAAGGKIAATEIVGLIARDALVDFAMHRLAVKDFDPSARILENRLDSLEIGWEAAAERVASALASDNPTPGGGSAAGIAGQMGCALAQMSIAVSLNSKKITEEQRASLKKAHDEFMKFREGMSKLTQEDAAAFGAFMTAYQLPKDDVRRAARMQSALKIAAEVPLGTARKASEAMTLVKTTTPLTVGTVSSDMNCATHLLRACALSALENVKINILSLKDDKMSAELKSEMDLLLKTL